MSKADATSSELIQSRNILASISLAGMLVLSVGVALCMVAIAYAMYYNSPQRKYDIARPGDKDINKVLNIEDNTQDDITKPVGISDARQRLDLLNKELEALNGFNSFGQDGVDDQALGLQPHEQPSQ